MEEQNTNGLEIKLSDLWMILKQCWWLMLIVLVVAFTSVAIFTFQTHTDQYTATASVWALGNTGNNTSTSDVSIGTYLVNDYKQMIYGPGVLNEVIEKEHLLISSTQLENMIKVTNEDNTRVLYVSITAQSPERAQSIANTLVNVFCERINAKNDDPTKTLITPWDPAQLPAKPSNPISLVKIALIAIVCAILVYAIYFVLFVLDDKISTADDVEKYLGVSVLGMIPNRDEARRKKMKKEYYYGYNIKHQYNPSSYNGGNHANH